MQYKKLSHLMLWAGFLSGLFYSASYPFIYAETLKAVTKGYISFETIVSCIGSFVFCGIWNKYSDKLFRGYRIILWTEIAADIFLFGYVLLTGNLKGYFVLNVLIYAIITKNLACGGTKMRAKVNPTEKLRERYDNNSNIVASAAALTGAGIALVYPFSLKMLFVFALVGNIIDNFFYLYIYSKIIRRTYGITDINTKKNK